MAVYRNIQTTFWTDAKVADEFTPEDKYFYLYIFTNPHTNLCGCYEISRKQMSWETGYSIETIDRLIERFATVHEVIRFDQDTRELLLINWYKYNWTSSVKFRKPLLKQIESIKCSKFKDFLMEIYKDTDTVSIPYQYGMDTTVTVSVTDTVSDTDKKKRKFTPPSVDEVRAYCNERGNGVDPEQFVAFYTSKGWKVGNNPMKDWKAAVITWEKRNKVEAPVKKDRSKLKALEQHYLSEAVSNIG